MKYGNDKSHDLQYIFDKNIEKVEMKFSRNCLRNNEFPGADKDKNAFLKYSGHKLIRVIKKLFKIIWDSEKIPSQWSILILIDVGKGNKDKKLLVNKRGITLSNTLCKAFEKIMVARLDKSLTSTESQAGARRSRSTVEHLFIFKFLIQHRTYFEKTETYVALREVIQSNMEKHNFLHNLE